MSEFKGTPGPWLVRRVGGVGGPAQIGYAIDFNEDQEQVVDYVYEEADAHLIAAAPDLLDALQSLKSELILSDVDMGYIESHFRPSLNKAAAAIAKALGQ